MKTRVRDLPEEDQMLRKLIRKYPDMNLTFDRFPGVVVAPVILTPDSTTKPGYAGVLEYQVSDGSPGERSTSYDVYRLADVHQAATELCAEMRGWRAVVETGTGDE